MRLSHDIWYQVIQYFERDGDSDAEKRTTLLNLALTSRLLSSLALATLWRNMSSMAPIVDVINSFTPHEEEPFLTWDGDGDGGGYWEFWRKPDGDQVDQRVKEYFSRIRHFWAYGKFPSEFALWPILIAWFWKGEPLLPNLHWLAISFDSDDSASYHPLTLMVPSTLRSIATVNVQSYRHMVEFYQHLLSQGCSPNELEYVGDLRFPPILTHFENLNKLVVKGPYKCDRNETPFSLAELLQDIPFLHWLEIDLRTLQNDLEGPLEPFEHPSLKTLILEGLMQELHYFLSSKITCPLVKRLSLKIRFTTELTWTFFFERVAAIFPNINHFSLQVLGPIEGVPQLDLSDLDILFPQPMEVFSLEGVPNKLARTDLHHMLYAWPKLRTLTLTGGKTPFDAEALLSTIHTNENLHTLNLPFDFIPLGFPLVFPPAPLQRNPMRRLYIASPSRFPSALKEKVILAQNLFILLPELKTVEMRDKNIGTGATDFRDIIRGMQAVVRSV